jgi:Ca2+-binding EF-hand superfamily protein
MTPESLNLEALNSLKTLIPEQRLATLTQTFAQIDSDQDGKVGVDEFLHFSLAAEEARLAQAFAAQDRDQDGFLSLEEYILATEPTVGILRRFQEMDLDHNGLISLAEALEIAEKLYLPLNAEQVQAIIRKVDGDGDGQVSYYEYLGAIAHIGFQ